MGRIILTGLTKNRDHKFSLDYVVVDDKERCIVNCVCGWQGEILSFQNYGGTKELAKLWDEHSKKRITRLLRRIRRI